MVAPGDVSGVGEELCLSTQVLGDTGGGGRQGVVTVGRGRSETHSASYGDLLLQISSSNDLFKSGMKDDFIQERGQMLCAGLRFVENVSNG